MRLPFEILHIHKGKSLEAYEVVNEQDYLWIVSLCPVRGGNLVVASNTELKTACAAFRFTAFEEAYAEYYRRITQFIKYKTTAIFKETLDVNKLPNPLPLP